MGAQAVYADKRVALVVGNGDYQHVSSLPNPTRDAADIAIALRSIGFEVKELQNANRIAFEEALSTFSDEATGADFAIMFFAGHGIEVDHNNYLVPVDAVLASDRRLRFEAIPLDDVLGALDGVKGIRMVLLDACRNNPFAGSMKLTTASRSIGRGLSRVEAADGTVISYSAKEGTVASDGDGQNSPFTAALLSNIVKPGLELQFLLREVRDSVLQTTRGAQEPYISASLPRDPVYLVPPPAGETSSSGTSSPGENTDQSMITDYQLAERVGTIEAWDAFLKKYGQKENFYVDLANAARRKLEPVSPSTRQSLPLESTQMAAADPADNADAEAKLTKDMKLQIELSLTKDVEIGNVDGEFDADTRAGIKSWQFVAGAKPTGILTQVQIDKLLGSSVHAPGDRKLAISYEKPPEGSDPRLVRVVDALSGTPFTYTIFNDHLYVAVADVGSISFEDAKDLAETAGGSLACISSAEENKLIFELIKEDPRFWQKDPDFISGPWIGLYQKKGSRSSKQGWTWVEGCKSTYRNWKGGQPNEVDLHNGEGAAAFGGNGTRPTAGWQDPILDKYNMPGLIIEIN